MTNTNPFEVSKAKLRPFRRSIKIVEAASSRSGRTGVIQNTYRPKTWAMEGRRKTVITDGDKEHTVHSYGGGPTKAGAVAGTGAGAGGLLALKAKKNSAVSKSNPFEISKKEKGPFRRPPFQNTRKENVKVGAVSSGAVYGSAGAALGATASRSNARHGLKALHEVGASPSKAVARKLVAGHATKGALATGIAAGAIGAGLGAAVGATYGPKGSKSGESSRRVAIARQQRKATKANAKAAEFAKSAFGVNH